MRSYCDSLRLFIDFLISSKMMKNNLIEDLRAMQTQSKTWAKSLNKHSPTREYEMIYDLFLVPWQLGALSKMNIVMLEICCSGIYLLIMVHDRDHYVTLLRTSVFNVKEKSVSGTQANKSIIQVIRILEDFCKSWSRRISIQPKPLWLVWIFY